jgi:septum formation protein
MLRREVGGVRITGVKLPPLILASASPRRSELLRELNTEFRVIPSNADEIQSEALSPGEMSQINAYRKARVISKKYPDELVIGMDTLVALEDTVFGKPSSLDDARQMLLRLQGRSHVVVTGVCLIHLSQQRQRIFAELTRVTFKPLSVEQIQAYHAAVNPLDKAGAYAIQERGEELVEAVEGSFSNVIGLPLERLRAELESF